MTTSAATVKEATADTRLRFRPSRVDFANFKPRHFIWQLSGKVATITLNRPERKNPLTLEFMPSCATPSATSFMPMASRVS